MHLHEDLKEIIAVLEQKKIGTAIAKLENFGYKYPELHVISVVEQIKNDYRLMAGYWSQGYKDPQLDAQYSQPLCRIYVLTANIALRFRQSHSTYLHFLERGIGTVVRKGELSSMQGQLENYVSEFAVLELGGVNPNKKKELYEDYHGLVSGLFNYIVISEQWSNGKSEVFKQILLSPTIDNISQQVLVSAITLSLINLFDINKFQLLFDVYRYSNDEYVRQRALVGWVLAIGEDKFKIYPELKALVEALLNDKDVCEEIVELQMQLVYCASAEQDTNTIQKEIMPDILKHNNLNITLNGIEEREESPMQDIFDPDASDRNMEKVEKSFRKMMDMQKEGRDVYFGGFSQMKRYPFFDALCNWFMPFYDNHPAINHINNKHIAQRLLSGGAFCNSDKYSFLLAFMQVFDKLPKNISEMFSNGEIPEHNMLSKEDLTSATYIRRIYLQDLYRFFRLYPSREEFYNPFRVTDDGSDYIFFAKKIFGETNLGNYSCRVASLLMKQNLNVDAIRILANYEELDNDYVYNLICGNMLLHNNKLADKYFLKKRSAVTCFEKALRLKPGSNKALTGLARALFYEGNYTRAKEVYAELLEQKPNDTALMLHECVCLVNLSKYSEALEKLYKLYYENPEKINVIRVLARALTGAKKYEQANNLYSKLLHEGNVGDRLNYGYCKWFMGDIKLAAEQFALYLKQHYNGSMSDSNAHEKAFMDIIEPEKEFIASHNISETEMLMMVDLVCESLY